MQKKYETLFKDAQSYKRQIIGVDEIKKDRDTRIKILRDDLEDLTLKLEKLEKDHAALTVAYDATSSENTKLLTDCKSMAENLSLANKVRNRTEEKLIDLQKQYNTLKNGFNECDKLMATFRRKYEEE